MPKINAPTIKEHKVATRAALIDAAAVVFLRDGLAGASVGSIADVAMIARTTVYEYFPNKDALLGAVLEERVPPLVERMISDLPEDGMAVRLEELFRRAFDLAGRFEAEAELLFRVSRELPKPERDAAWSVLEPVRTEIDRTCRTGVESGEFAGGDVASLGIIVRDLLVGGIDRLTKGGGESIDVVATSWIRFLLAGIANS